MTIYAIIFPPTYVTFWRKKTPLDAWLDIWNNALFLLKHLNFNRKCLKFLFCLKLLYKFVVPHSTCSILHQLLSFRGSVMCRNIWPDFKSWMWLSDAVITASSIYDIYDNRYAAYHSRLVSTYGWYPTYEGVGELITTDFAKTVL